MNTNLKNAALALLGCMVWMMGSGARADEAGHALCQGGYSEMLMTPGECQYYLENLSAAERRADKVAVLNLNEWHTALLIERSQLCPCQASAAPMRRLDAIKVSALQPSRLARN